MSEGRSRTWSAVLGRLAGTAMVAVLAAALVAMVQAPAGATTTNPYSGSGYDASYPNCSAGPYPTGVFAIIGLGGGRPFTTSSCLSSEWAAAPSGATPSTPSLYFNTGYSGAYARDITSTCRSDVGNAPIPAGTSRHQVSSEQQAWEIGCSEADYAVLNEPGAPAMWWADIETGNSWSRNTTLNDFTVDGMAYRMAASGVAGGVYSTPSMWNRIVGAGFVSNPALSADWEPGTSCPSTGFSLQAASSYAPVWVIQDGSLGTGGGSVDADMSCP